MRLDRLPPRTEGGFHVVVESPRGSAVKLALDPELGCIAVSRPLPLGLVYPFDWGFVPGTKGPDGDPVDALVYWEVATFPGVVVPCRALGVLQLEQSDGEGGRQRNDRLLAVPLAHPRGGELRTFADVPARVRDELALFFTSAVFFEPKDPRLLGWAGPEAAEALLGG
ncbi:inorganic diphosphatase [Anaeromyxobacter diazotrophicus]|uniref:inorganic diphosphatase n=1 Tax=Anaeromyxobacter diazotrophicus TaxID=2590199 RepID=A0A7I9VM49_9BACT|nr:inorganic diphosphatase [Anaeromyxobacter diazotrophicus]GEJ57483.1 inorganic pyrophosphatase [Anaeromyxobacter diazotrophicus]